MPKKNQKNMTIDDLAVMVAEGFNEMQETMATKENIKRLEGYIGSLSADVNILKSDVSILKADVSGLKKDMNRLNNSVKNYLELSDKRYLELRQTNAMLVKYIKLIIAKTKISVNTKDLESIL
jgi:predicted RNase H-like nuclease (RuvC/YqgF family)